MWNDHFEICKLLLDHDSILDLRTEGGPSIIHAAQKGHDQIISGLILDGADINVRGLTSRFYNDTALIAACCQSHVDVVPLLITSGADLNIVDTAYTALQIDP
jgi:ankyrin repeat protein